MARRLLIGIVVNPQQGKAIMSNFISITEAQLGTIVGGAKRDPQVDVNGAITGGDRIVRSKQVDSNGAITGGERIHPVLRYKQGDENGAIVGGQRIR
jgi:hypothetical protein